MILDKENFYKSSCIRQAPLIKQVYEAGGQIWIIKPKGRIGGGYPSFHVKTIIIDNRLVLSGSVNCSNNGHGNNKEHMWSITTRVAVRECVEDFEQTLLEAERIDRDHMWVSDTMGSFHRDC